MAYLTANGIFLKNAAGTLLSSGVSAESEEDVMTFLVAASNALASTKAKADYTCDGTADQVQIQAAHDALGSGGGQIVLSEGTFNLSGTVTVTKPVHLTGSGYATLVSSAVNGVAIQFGDGVTRLNGPAVSGIRLVGNTGTSAVGLYLHDCDFAEVAGMWIRNFGAAGIKIDNAVENTRIHDNNIDSLDSFSTAGTKYGIQIVTSAHDVTICDNHIEGWKVGVYGNEPTNSADWLIRNNAFDDNTTADVHLIGITSVSILGNNFGNCANASGYSVVLDYTNCPLGEGGNFEETAVMITGNYFVAMESGAIHITNGEGHTITGNVFQSVDGYPVLLDHATSGNYDRAEMAVIADNTVQMGQESTTGGRSKAIKVADFNRVNIVNNSLSNQESNCIEVVANQARISGNNIKGANSLGTASSLISLKGTHCIVSENIIILGSVTNSIVEETGSDYNLFLNNITDDGVAVVGANTVSSGNVEV
jgi:hypothetical protein